MIIILHVRLHAKDDTFKRRKSNVALPSTLIPPETITIETPIYPVRQLLLPEYKHSPAEQSVSRNDTDEDADPGALETNLIPVLVQDTSSCNLTLRRELGLVHAVAAGATGVRLMLELIDHHALEDPSLRIVSLHVSES